MRGLCVLAWDGAVPRGCWCRAANRSSKQDLAHRHGGASRFEIDIAMWRGLHGGDQGFASEVALEPAIFFGRNNDDFVASVHGHALRSLAADAPHQLAKASLCFLQQPMARFRMARAAAWLRRSGFYISSHAD